MWYNNKNKICKIGKNMKKTFDPVEDNVTPKPLRIISKIIKITLLAGLILMLGWLTLRSCYQDGTGKVKKYMWTDATVSLAKEENIKVYRLVEYNNPELSMLFFIHRPYYTENNSQLQFMLRYNTLSKYYKELNFKEGDSFEFELTDGNGKHYTDYCYVTDKGMMYRYYRIAFENVDVEVDNLYVIIYHVSDEGRNEIGRCIVWDIEGPRDEYELTKEKKNVSVPDDIVYSTKEN